jgi:oligoribonuclease NrnB/cAMP/cGMP phosphodiesterase (DHH superfamily)
MPWKYIHGDKKPIPRAVELIADFDIWKFEYGDATWNFHYSCYGENTDPEYALMNCWRLWLDAAKERSERYEPTVEDTRGHIIRIYKKITDDEQCRRFGYETEFEGLKCFAINGLQGSMAFGERQDKYEGLLAYIHNGTKFLVSIYTTKDINVSKIAVKYGGGGHPQAAGFLCEELPWLSKG